MKKKFVLAAALIASSLALACNLKPGIAVLADNGSDLVKEWDFTNITWDEKVSSYTTTWSSDGLEFYGFNNNNGGWNKAAGGGKNKANAVSTIVTEQPIDAAVSYVDVSVLTFSTSTKNFVLNSVSLEASSSFEGFTGSYDVEVLKSDFDLENKIIRLSCPTGQWPEGSYYKLYFDWTNTSTSNARFELSSISFYGPAASAIKVSDITITAESEAVYEGMELQFEASVYPDDASVKTVRWSVDKEEIATIDSASGTLTGIKPGIVTVTATATDGSGVYDSKEITVMDDPLLNFEYEGTAVKQIVGNIFNASGLSFYGTYEGKGRVLLSSEDIVFTPSEIVSDTSSVVASFEGKELTIPVEIENEQTTIFGQYTGSSSVEGDNNEPFANWELTYKRHVMTYDYFTVTFSSAIRQTSTITNAPVSKTNGSTLTLEVKEGYALSYLKFAFERWATKVAGLSFEVYGDNGQSVATDTIEAFKDPATQYFEYKASNQSGYVKKAVVTLKTDDQVGFYSMSYALESIGTSSSSEDEAANWAGQFLNNETGIVCDENGIVPPDTDKWLELGLMYLDLTSEAKAVLTNAVASETGTVIEQAVARYDYIIGKYNPENDPTSDYENYMNREVKPMQAFNGTPALENSDIEAALSLALLGLTCIAGLGFVFYKKRKEAR